MNNVKHSFSQPNYCTEICADKPWLAHGVCIS